AARRDRRARRRRPRRGRGDRLTPRRRPPRGRRPRGTPRPNRHRRRPQGPPRLAARDRPAAGRTRLDLAGPAPVAQRVRLLPRGFAGLAGDIGPAVAERRSADRCLIVPFLVPATPLFGMKALAVQLDNQSAVLRVITVTVPIRPVGLPEARLLDRLGKPVCTLNVPVVPVFQYRVCAPGRHGDDLVEFPPPAELLTLSHRPPQVRLAGELPAEGTGDKRDHIVEVRGGLDEVDDRFLDKGMRRETIWLPGPAHSP